MEQSTPQRVYFFATDPTMNSSSSPEKSLLSEHRAILPIVSGGTASGRSLPALMWEAMTGVAETSPCTCRPRVAHAGDDPRYGTCTISTPAIILNNSPVTCFVDAAGRRHVMLPEWLLA